MVGVAIVGRSGGGVGRAAQVAWHGQPVLGRALKAQRKCEQAQA